MRYRGLFLFFTCAALGRAAVIFSGVLDPASNTHLIAWDPFLPGYVAAIGGPTDADRAYNIAVYNFSVGVPGLVGFSSVGYGLGGFDSVVSVFQGVGNSASYVYHQYSPVAPGDFSFDLNLGAGDYTLAISMTFNEPCAAGFCFVAGTFADGFTDLVNFDPLRPDPLFYKVSVTENANIPEPATGVLAALAAVVVLVCRRWSSRTNS